MQHRTSLLDKTAYMYSKSSRVDITKIVHNRSKPAMFVRTAQGLSSNQNEVAINSKSDLWRTALLRGVHEIANDTIINWKMRIAEIEETMARPTTPVHRDRRDLLNVFGDLSKPIFGTATLCGRKGSKMSPTAQSRGTRSMLASKWFRSVATMSRVFGSCESRLSETNWSESQRLLVVAMFRYS